MGTDNELRCGACTGGMYQPRVTLRSGGGAVTGVCDTCGDIRVLHTPSPGYFEPEPAIYQRLAAWIEAEREGRDGRGTV